MTADIRITVCSTVYSNSFPPRLVTRRIDPLTDPRPLRHLYPQYQFHTRTTHSPGDNILCTPFRYSLAFRSKRVYLSFASISASVGISAFHRSIAAIVSPPCFSSAVESVSTSLSTRCRRLRWRYFCGADMRQGIFLCVAGQRDPWRRNEGREYHSRPPNSGWDGRKAPNIAIVELE